MASDCGPEIPPCWGRTRPRRSAAAGQACWPPADSDRARRRPSESPAWTPSQCATPANRRATGSANRIVVRASAWGALQSAASGHAARMTPPHNRPGRRWAAAAARRPLPRARSRPRQRWRRGRDRLDRRKFGRHDRRRLGFAALDPEYLGAGENPMGRRAKACPTDHGKSQKAQRRPHCGSSAGKMWRVLSQRLAPPPRCSETARAAASIAITLPTTSRGIDLNPSRQP